MTRQAEEKFIPACCVPKFRGYSVYMIWACVTSYRKGPLVVFERDWGNINSDLYCEKDVPVIHDFENSHKVTVSVLLLIEDGAVSYNLL